MADVAKLSMRAISGRVLLSADGEPIGLISWQAAKEFAVALKRDAQQSASERIGCILPAEGRPIGLDLDRKSALRVAAGLHAAGALAEEQAMPLEVVTDQAVLIRCGAPIRLGTDQRIFDEAWKEAQWSRELRKTPMAGIPSRERFGLLIVSHA